MVVVVNHSSALLDSHPPSSSCAPLTLRTHGFCRSHGFGWDTDADATEDILPLYLYVKNLGLTEAGGFYDRCEHRFVSGITVEIVEI